MDKTKVIKEYQFGIIRTGYYDKNHRFILHSFDDEPAEICSDGSKYWYRVGLYHREGNKPAIIYRDGRVYWYENAKQYWFIDNRRYNTLDEVTEIYKDKIFKAKYGIAKNLNNMNIEFIIIGICVYIIPNDSDRNEVILRYG